MLHLQYMLVTALIFVMGGHQTLMASAAASSTSTNERVNVKNQQRDVVYDDPIALEILRIKCLQRNNLPDTARNQHIMDFVLYVFERQFPYSKFDPNILPKDEYCVFKQEVLGFLFYFYLYKVNCLIKNNISCETFGDTLVQNYFSMQKYNEEDSELQERFGAFFAKYREQVLEYKEHCKGASQSLNNVERISNRLNDQYQMEKLNGSIGDLLAMFDDFTQHVKSAPVIPITPLEPWAQAAKQVCIQSIPGSERRAYHESIWDFLYSRFRKNFAADLCKLKKKYYIDFLNQEFDSFCWNCEKIRNDHVGSAKSVDILNDIDLCFKAEFEKAQQFKLGEGVSVEVLNGLIKIHADIQAEKALVFGNIGCALACRFKKMLREKEQTLSRKLKIIQDEADSTRGSDLGASGELFAALRISEDAAWKKLIEGLAVKHEMSKEWKDQDRKNQAMILATHCLLQVQTEGTLCHQCKCDLFRQGLEQRNQMLAAPVVKATFEESEKQFLDMMIDKARLLVAHKKRLLEQAGSELELQKRMQAEQQEQAEQEAIKQSRQQWLIDEIREKNNRMNASLSDRADSTMPWPIKRDPARRIAVDRKMADSESSKGVKPSVAAAAQFEVFSVQKFAEANVTAALGSLPAASAAVVIKPLSPELLRLPRLLDSEDQAVISEAARESLLPPQAGKRRYHNNPYNADKSIGRPAKPNPVIHPVPFNGCSGIDELGYWHLNEFGQYYRMHELGALVRSYEEQSDAQGYVGLQGQQESAGSGALSAYVHQHNYQATNCLQYANNQHGQNLARYSRRNNRHPNR